MHIILMGAPGSGKGTQAKIIKQKYNVPHISTGDIIRNNIKLNNYINKKLSKIIYNGQLLPDKFIMKIIKNRIFKLDCNNGFILDGFPRTINQAKQLDNLGVNIDYIFNIDLPNEIIIERIIGRMIDSKSGEIYHIKFNPPKFNYKNHLINKQLIIRTDDNKKTIQQRLEIYYTENIKLINFYKNYLLNNTKKPIYIKINGNQSIKKVSQDIFNKLNYFIKINKLKI